MAEGSDTSRSPSGIEKPDDMPQEDWDLVKPLVDVKADLSDATTLLRQTRKLLRTVYGSKAGFAFQAREHVNAVEAFLKEHGGF